MHKHHGIKDVQLCFMIIGAYVVYNFMDAGKKMYRSANTGGWISMFFVFLICVVLFKVIVYVMFSFEGESALTFYPKLMGRKLAFYVFLYNGIVYTFISAINIRFSGEVIKYTVLPRTPLATTCFLMALLTFYGLLKKLPTIVRLSEVYGYLGLGIIVAIAIIMSLNMDFYNIRPVFALSDLKCYFKGIFSLQTSFVGLDILLLLPLDKKLNKNFKRNGVIALFALYIIYVFIGTVTIGVMGTAEVDSHINIFFVASRIVNAEGLDFLRRLDGLFYIGWFVTIFLAIIIYGFIATVYLNELFENITLPKPIKESFPSRLKEGFKKLPGKMRSTYTYTALVVSFVAFLLALIPKNFQDVEFFIERIQFIYVFITILLPLMVGYLTWFSRKKHIDKLGGD